MGGLVFGRSLRAGRTPLITRIVEGLYGQAGMLITPEQRRYTRRLTLAWAVLLCGLTLANLVLGLCAEPSGVLAQLGHASPLPISDARASLFANLLAYGVIGGFFVGEYLLRGRWFPQRPYRNLPDFLRQMARQAGFLARSAALSAWPGAATDVHIFGDKTKMPLARMPSRLAWAVFNLLQLAFTLAFTAGGIVYALASLAITRDADRLLRMGSWMWAPVLFRGAGATVIVEGRERVDWSKNYLFVSNHQSIIDICALFHALPVPLRFLLKEEMRKGALRELVCARRQHAVSGPRQPQGRGVGAAPGGRIAARGQTVVFVSRRHPQPYRRIIAIQGRATAGCYRCWRAGGAGGAGWLRQGLAGRWPVQGEAGHHPRADRCADRGDRAGCA